MKLNYQQFALLLLALAFTRSFLIATITPPSYGSDGPGYLAYRDAVEAPNNPDYLWHIRGTTPVYPLFSNIFAEFGGGYAIVLAQVILGGLAASALYLGLRHLHELGARLAGLLVALDPQTGQALQMVATEGLYIPLLILGMAALWWSIERKPHPAMIFALGLLLGVGSLTRPMGTYLIVPYVFFFAILTRSIHRSALLATGYVTVALICALFNLWRFDFFHVNNNSGLYLGTRLFGVEGMYDAENGPHSQKIAGLLEACEIALDDPQYQANRITLVQSIRICLHFDHDMDLDQISGLYHDVYSESVQAKPATVLKGVIEQSILYTVTQSDPYDLDDVEASAADCSVAGEEWYALESMFCPAIPRPLAKLQPFGSLALIGFNLLTHFPNFLLALAAWPRSTPRVRWLWVFCLGFYGYHMLVTAFAGTILSRYVTVTNPYMLVTLGFALAAFWHRLDTSLKSS